MKKNNNNNSFMFYPEISDSDFNEKLYLKKEFRDIEIQRKDNIHKKKDFTLDQHQIFLRNYISPDTPYNGVLVYHGVGSGKCLLKGTPIIMHDGSIKNVEDIKINDLLMGDDSLPRKVLSLARGNDKMYDIIQKNNDKYTVNSEHILCLKALNYPILKKNNKNIIIKWIDNNNFKLKKFTLIDEEKSKRFYDNIKNNSNILEISINNYLELSNSKKKILKGYSVSVDFPEIDILIDPYDIGLYIGNNKIYNENIEKEFNFNNKKYIPNIYKYNLYNIRLKLLAGIIDSIGSIENNSFKIKISNNIINNNEILIKDIIYLVRSLGFNILKKYKNKNIYYIISKEKDIINIPTIIDNNKLNQHNYINSNINQSLTNIKVKFLRNDEYYGFTLDGNCRFLLGDFTVTHNTCTAISIAEGFKRTLKNMNKKILVLTYLKKNFEKELYNFEKEKDKFNPEDIVQCTGKEYELGEESKYLTQLQKEKEISKMIRSYYQFFGYGGFANYIIERTGGWKGDEKDMNEKIKNVISKEFDDRVIIIDEIQNIKTDKNKELTKNIQPLLQNIIKYGKNIKLILMSATPMFDRPDEIIFYINLLLENDGREKLNKNDIFNSHDSTLKENAINILRKAFTGYVSYVRAEKPYIFPFRIYPKQCLIPKIEYYINGKKIDKNMQIKYTKLILCQMNDIQKNTYIYYLDKKIKDGKIQNIINNNVNNDVDNKKDSRILHDLINISNITFPISKELNKDNIGSFSKISIDTNYDNGCGGYYRTTNLIGSKKKIQYKYQSHAIFNKNKIDESPFCDEKHLYKYSTKYAHILETVKKSKGLIFIFSNFIEQGVLPLALMLEQNGFTRECNEGEEQLLDYNANKLKGGGKKKEICYWCGKDAKYKDHNDEKSKDYHFFKRAKYILYFVESKDIIKIKKEDALEKFCNKKNKYGEDIKIFIGTRAVSEGLDFRMLRQVHILEPWYNLSRHEQIIGRAIRFYSHKLLLPEERNVEIYQYASILSPNTKYGNRESVDLKNYRLAENKDIIIKKITRIMKESAVDCVFLKKINVINSNKKEKQITSSGEILYVDIADKPLTNICDYEESCNYKCNWTPNPRINYPINTDTYNIYFAKNDIEQIKKEIKFMFRQDIVYDLSIIEEHILNQYKEVDKLFIYIALEELVNNKNEIVYDKFSRKGYIIYRGDYYIFQPLDLERDDLPLIYRTYPTSTNPYSVNLENINIDYKIDNSKQHKNDKLNNSKFIENINNNIEEIYNKYIYIGKDDKKKYIQAIIGYIFDKLDNNQVILFIQDNLTNYLTNKLTKYTNDIINYLKNKKILINYYYDILFNKSKKTDLYVGYIINNNYYILESVNKTKNIKLINKKIKFILCDKDIILKIKAYRNVSKKNNVVKTLNYNNIYGMLEYSKKGKKFKIIDKTIEENVYTKNKKISKRSIITGRMCSTYKIQNLLEIRKKIGLENITIKKKIDYFCEELEIYLRYNEIINYKNKTWFID